MKLLHVLMWGACLFCCTTFVSANSLSNKIFFNPELSTSNNLPGKAQYYIRVRCVSVNVKVSRAATTSTTLPSDGDPIYKKVYRKYAYFYSSSGRYWFKVYLGSC